MNKNSINYLIADFMKDVDKKWSREEKSLEKLRTKFISDYRLEKINDMTIQDYVLGQSNKNNFCYRLGTELEGLGSLGQNFPDNFLVYFNKTKQDYKFTDSVFDPDLSNEENFRNIKSMLYDVIHYGGNIENLETREILRKNRYKSHIKMKIISVYYPESVIYLTKSRAKEILSYLQISYLPQDSFFVIQDKIRLWCEHYLPNVSNYLRMVFLTSYLAQDISYDGIDVDIVADLQLNDTLEEVDLDDSTIVESGQIELLFSNGKTYYKRNPNIAKRAILNANHKCELECGIKLFKRHSNEDIDYVEAHHLVPMSYQYNYVAKGINLDTVDNIVSLCPHCHTQIHRGTDRDQLIRKLYQLRENKLKELGINIDIEDLIKIY